MNAEFIRPYGTERFLFLQVTGAKAPAYYRTSLRDTGCAIRRTVCMGMNAEFIRPYGTERFLF